jgi:hypothetical protein
MEENWEERYKRMMRDRDHWMKLAFQLADLHYKKTGERLSLGDMINKILSEEESRE